MREIVFTDAAIRQLKKLAPAVRSRIVAKLDRYAATGAGNVKTLQGIDALRLRDGDWRVVFTIEGDTILVHKIAHRREVY